MDAPSEDLVPLSLRLTRALELCDELLGLLTGLARSPCPTGRRLRGPLLAKVIASVCMVKAVVDFLVEVDDNGSSWEAKDPLG